MNTLGAPLAYYDLPADERRMALTYARYVQDPVERRLMQMPATIHDIADWAHRAGFTRRKGADNG